MLTLSIRYVVILILALFLLHGLLNTIPDSGDEPKISLLEWIKSAVTGDLKTRNYEQSISFYEDAENLNQVSVATAFTSSFFSTTLAVLLIWTMATLLNSAMLSSSWMLRTLAGPLSKMIGLFSNIHIMVIGLIFYIIFNDHVNYFGILLMIGISSNIYYDLESEQRLYFVDILQKDYVLHARAMGDSVLKHILKPVSTFSVTQLLGVWPSVLTNAIFVEIIFQKSGIGSLLYQNILAPGIGNNLKPEIDVLMYVASIIVFLIIVISYIKECILLRLIK